MVLLLSLTLIDWPTFIIQIHDCSAGAYKAGTVFLAREATPCFQGGWKLPSDLDGEKEITACEQPPSEPPVWSSLDGILTLWPKLWGNLSSYTSEVLGAVKRLIVVVMKAMGHCFILTARERKGKNGGKQRLAQKKHPMKTIRNKMSQIYCLNKQLWRFLVL